VPLFTSPTDARIVAAPKPRTDTIRGPKPSDIWAKVQGKPGKWLRIGHVANRRINLPYREGFLVLARNAKDGNGFDVIATYVGIGQ
jgi:hypothetical protein